LKEGRCRVGAEHGQQGAKDALHDFSAGYEDNAKGARLACRTAAGQVAS
jgi:hypothetical protein